MGYLPGRSIVLGITGFFLTQCASVDQPDITPVSKEADGAAIRLAPVGRYSVGFFNVSGAVPARYDPESRLLFVVTGGRGWVDFVDIDDPSVFAG